MIKFSTGETVETLSIYDKIENFGGSDRHVATITITGIDFLKAKELFSDGAIWSIINGDVSYDSWNSYTKAGAITDNRDGTITVKMGMKNTEEEELKEIIDIIVGIPVSSCSGAKTMRVNLEDIIASAKDGDAAKIPSLSKEWVVGEQVEAGNRRYYPPTQKLYKVREGKAHKTQADWTPDKTPDLWVVVDIEHAGTKEDPIPASKGMEYIYGKYYLDNEDDNVYLCKREQESEGGIVLQYLPHELVGQYFELAK